MKRAIFFLTIIFSTNLIGMYFGFYQYWWFDMSLHFLGGFFMAALMVHYLSNIIETDDLPTGQAGKRQATSIKKHLIIISAVSFIGVVWEFAEYLAGQTLIEPIYNNFGIRAYFIGDLDDTINDLLMDVMGALAWLVIFKRDR